MEHALGMGCNVSNLKLHKFYFRKLAKPHNNSTIFIGIDSCIT